MKVVCGIQARLGSTRLPGKVLYTLGGKRVIEWVVARSVESSVVDTTYVMIGDEPENEAIIELCDRENIPYVQGPEDNLLERHKLVSDRSNCDVFCRVTGDCPFVPTSEINRTVGEHLDNDADYTTNKGEGMPIGTAVHALDSEVLDVLADREQDHPVRPIRENPEEWDVTYTVEDRWTQFSGAHTAVDTPEDYWNLVDAVKAVGTGPYDVAEWLASRA